MSIFRLGEQREFKALEPENNLKSNILNSEKKKSNFQNIFDNQKETRQSITVNVSELKKKKLRNNEKNLK